MKLLWSLDYMEKLVDTGLTLTSILVLLVGQGQEQGEHQTDPEDRLGTGSHRLYLGMDSPLSGIED